MSALKINTLQIGQSGTATNNFCWSQPSTPDGTVRLGNGNAGSATDILIATSSGNLGLGVTPSASWQSGRVALQIQRASAGGGVVIHTAANSQANIGANYYYDGTNSKYLSSSYASSFDQLNGAFIWYTAPSGTAGNAISFTQAMTLDASGNLLVGTTTKYGEGGMTYDAAGFEGTGQLRFNRSARSTLSYPMDFRNGGTAVGFISYSSTATTYSTSSDQRLKTNITPAASAIQSILNFPVDQFDWIASGEHQDFGAIAQKVQPIIPEMVNVPADENEMWGIDWSKAVPRLIRTIQELSAELNELKAKVNA